MTAQPPLPLVAAPDAVPVGAAAALAEDADGGRVFLHGSVVFAWDAGQEDVRRMAAVQLVNIRAATVVDVAVGFGVGEVTLWRWQQRLAAEGAAGMARAKPGPKGPSKVTDQMRQDMIRRREDRESFRAIGAAVGVSDATVRAVIAEHHRITAAAAADHAGIEDHDDDQVEGQEQQDGAGGRDIAGDGAVGQAVQDGLWPEAASVEAPAVLPVLPDPRPRTGERAAAWAGLIAAAAPVFAPAARVPLAGLFLALPALECTGLLAGAKTLYGALPDGFYGLDTVLLEAVLRTLAGEPRVEGASRIDPAAMGRILGMDRAPEVKTIRRKFDQLATAGKAGQLLESMATTKLATHQAAGDGTGDEGLAAVLYVDGHIRAYQGTRKIGKAHSTRLKFPAPATAETWVHDGQGDPVLMVLAEPGASLVGELRRLLPVLREVIGDERRVLVGFDRGGWSPALFRDMAAAGFDVLTWRKGATEDLSKDLFSKIEHVDEAGRTHQWRLAESTVALALDQKKDPEVFAMRQITLKVDTNKNTNKNTKKKDDTSGKDSVDDKDREADEDTGGEEDQDGTGARQIHLLTTIPAATDIGAGASAGELVYRMGSRWRQENHFRYARMRFDLDAHDSYAASDDDPDRSVPNPAKDRARKAVNSATAHVERERARTDAALLAARTPAPGQKSVTVSNELHNTITAELRAAEEELAEAKTLNKQTPTRVRLGDIAPGQQVLDTETKQLTHAIRIAAFNTATTLARELRVNTGYARADDEAHTLIRQLLRHSGDIDTTVDGQLTIRLDPLPTGRATRAAAELCDHLTQAQARYPGTDLLMRYEVKNPA